MKVLATFAILVGFISISHAQGESSSLVLVKTAYKPFTVTKTMNPNVLDLNAVNPATTGYKLYGKFTAHPATSRTFAHLPTLTFLKGTLPLRLGTSRCSLKYTQGIQLDKHNFLYFNLAF